MRTRRRCSAGQMLMVALVLVAGLHCTVSAEDWSIIALVCADGDLAQLGENYARGLTEAAMSGGWTLALRIDNGTERPERRLLIEGREAQVATPAFTVAGNSVDGDVLADCFRWAGEAAPADRYALIVYGHGVSASGRDWNGQRTAMWPSVGIDVSGAGNPLTPAGLARAITGGLGRKVDIVVLDCCYGASLEFASDLQAATDLLIAAPGRLHSDGIPWHSALGVSAEAGAPDSVAQAWAEAPRGLSSVQTGGLGEVLTALQRLCGTLAADMDRHVPAVTAAASASARWGGEGEMCDLRAFCAALAAAEDRVADVARQTVAAIDACSAGPVTMPFAAGLSTAPAQFRADGFTETSGWGEMTRLYRNRLDELMHRTFDDRRHDGAAT